MWNYLSTVPNPEPDIRGWTKERRFRLVWDFSSRNFLLSIDYTQRKLGMKTIVAPQSSGTRDSLAFLLGKQ